MAQNQLMQNNPQDTNLKLYKAIFQGNRSKVLSILRDEPTALTAAINERSETPLHVAVGVGRANKIVPLLLKKLLPATNNITTLLDGEQNTVLMVAALVGNTREAAMLLLGAGDASLLVKEPNAEGSTPLLKAAEYGNKRMVRYLLYYDLKGQSLLLSQGQGVLFVRHLLNAGFYDVALYVIERTRMIEPSSLTPAELQHLPNDYESLLEIVAERPACFSIWRKRDKVIYVQLIKSLCKKISRSSDFLQFKNPLLLAAKLGVQEVVEEILNLYPDAIWFTDDDGHNIFHLSVIHRHENIFGILCAIYGCKNLPIGVKDISGKNILHLVAEPTPSNKLTSFCGPALCMQYELKWYKEVQKHIQPSYSTELNNNQTPSMIFTNAHESLVKAGEKWIKGAATAGSVAATLIATVVFAAAINVPGGSKDGEGFPNLKKRNLYHVFLYADGLGLFLSLTSVLMFMSLLASGYAESDFQDALPNRLLFGLITLLFSLTSMVVAFLAAFLLAIGGHFTPSTGYTLLQLTYIPGFLFLWLLYPLLSQMIKLTWLPYLPSIFRAPKSSLLSWQICPILPIFLFVEQLQIRATYWLCVLDITAVQFIETLY